MSLGCPVIVSWPTSARINPKQVAISPRMIDCPVKAQTRLRERTMREKYSAGPSSSAKLASTGPKSISPMMLRVPPAKEPIAARPRATPARPCLARGFPSNMVTTEADSPGTFISTEVIVPPYWVP